MLVLRPATLLKRYRSSHQKCSIKRAVLKNFSIFTGKHLCRSRFLLKLWAFRPATLSKRNSNTGVFLWILWYFWEHPLWKTPMNNCFWRYSMLMLSYQICEISNNTYLEEHLRKTLLFVSPQNTVTMGSGELGLDETSTECILFN